MIPIRFGLWHSGVNLSYLRYLTFKTLRHFHPEASIQLYLSSKFKNSNHEWIDEKQDFEDAVSIKNDYLDKLDDIGIEVIKVDWFSQYEPNYQSDLFRWWFLKHYGGFYLDTDQVILKSFSGLPLDKDFIYSGYPAKSCGYYTPVGVIGSDKNVDIVNAIHINITKFVDNKNYNSAGPFMFNRVLNSFEWKSKMFNAPANYFYPIAESYMVDNIYNGKLEIPKSSFALHWYGGHPLSQKFNKVYTEEYAQNSKDIISVFLRKEGLV